MLALLFVRKLSPPPHFRGQRTSEFQDVPSDLSLCFTSAETCTNQGAQKVEPATFEEMINQGGQGSVFLYIESPVSPEAKFILGNFQISELTIIGLDTFPLFSFASVEAGYVTNMKSLTLNAVGDEVNGYYYSIRFCKPNTGSQYYFNAPCEIDIYTFVGFNADYAAFSNDVTIMGPISSITLKKDTVSCSYIKYKPDGTAETLNVDCSVSQFYYTKAFQIEFNEMVTVPITAAFEPNITMFHIIANSPITLDFSATSWTSVRYYDPYGFQLPNILLFADGCTIKTGNGPVAYELSSTYDFGPITTRITGVSPTFMSGVFSTDVEMTFVLDEGENMEFSKLTYGFGSPCSPSVVVKDVKNVPRVLYSGRFYVSPYAHAKLGTLVIDTLKYDTSLYLFGSAVVWPAGAGIQTNSHLTADKVVVPAHVKTFFTAHYDLQWNETLGPQEIQTAFLEIGTLEMGAGLLSFYYDGFWEGEFIPDLSFFVHKKWAIGKFKSIDCKKVQDPRTLMSQNGFFYGRIEDYPINEDNMMNLTCGACNAQDGSSGDICTYLQLTKQPAFYSIIPKITLSTGNIIAIVLSYLGIMLAGVGFFIYYIVVSKKKVKEY